MIKIRNTTIISLAKFPDILKSANTIKKTINGRISIHVVSVFFVNYLNNPIKTNLFYLSQKMMLIKTNISYFH